MKKLLLTTILCAISSSALAVDLADEDFYGQINAGYVIPSSPGGSFTGAKFKKTFIVGAEGGLSLLDNARAGISVDFLPDLKYNGQATVNETGPYGGQYTNQSNTSIKVKSAVAMLNLYYDFDRFGIFSPYLMIGVGMSQNKTNSSSYQGFNVGNVSTGTGSSLNTYNTVSVGSQTIPGAKKSNFAFKAGIGTRIAMSNRVSLDLRYQYINLGKFRTGNQISGAVTSTQTVSNGTTVSSAVATTKNGTASVTPLSGHIRVQEMMMGLVYKF